MLFLLLAVCSSASIALLFKLAERVKASGPVITTVNYLTAVAISGAMVLLWGPPFQIAPPLAFVGQLSHSTALGSLSLAQWLGLLTGVLYLVSFVVYQKAIRQNGASLAGMCSKLGILLPMLISIVAWREYPGLLKWAGILLALFSIVIVNLEPGMGLRGWKASLLLTFFFTGFAEFMTKIYQRYGMEEYQNHFLLVVFATALLLSLVLLLRQKARPDVKSCLLGVAVGVPNLLSPFFLMKALASMPAAAVFPVYSAGSVAVILLGGFLFFRERLKTREKAAAVLTLCAMILVNL